ncbi:MAG TPA: hypothetical protein VGT05_03425 [Patescibacteria group bacterium]|nr:hypothetical protein [Patescibacteria group bacterium]
MFPAFPPTITEITPFSVVMSLFVLILLPLGGFYVGLQYQQIFDGQAEALCSGVKPCPLYILLYKVTIIVP